MPVARGLYQGDALFAGCLCVDPRAPRCEAGPECDISAIQFSHCADPSLTCLVTLDVSDGDKPLCTEAHCGVGVPTSIDDLDHVDQQHEHVHVDQLHVDLDEQHDHHAAMRVDAERVRLLRRPRQLHDPRQLHRAPVGAEADEGRRPHDVDNRYVWAGCCGDGCQTACQPNAAAAATCMAMAENGTYGCTAQCPTGACYVERGGLAVTTIFDWINQINAENFAGHSDWRVPTEAGFNPTGSRELESIVQHPCAGMPCIDPIFGPTIRRATGRAPGTSSREIDAWFVNFFDGPYSNLNKREPLFVRAVR